MMEIQITNLNTFENGFGILLSYPRLQCSGQAQDRELMTGGRFVIQQHPAYKELDINEQKSNHNR